MRTALVMAFVACAHTQQGGETACWQSAADAGELALPQSLADELAATHQQHCLDVPDAGTSAWYQDCAPRFRDYMNGHCNTAVPAWCSAHCGSNDCGSATNKQAVNKLCAQRMLPGFLASMRYCSGLKLKENESYLAEPTAGGPTCP